MELKDLRRLFAKWFLIILLLFVAPCSVLAMPAIMPLDQLQNGMTGRAYTVIDSSGKIEQFDVKIIGVVGNTKGSSRLIMAQASGEVVERTGGILQGMSGSPIYIDGKLVGALAATLKEMSPYTFFITPIENMLELWKLPDPMAQLNNRKTIKKEEPAKETPESNDADKVTQLATVYSGGFDTEGLKFLAQELGLNNLQTTALMKEQGIKLDASLEPGSPVGVAIIYGDFTLGAMGTITAVEGKRVLAMGHSFTHGGNVNYFMTDSSVVGTVSGVSNGSKVSNMGYIIGRVNQDREAGITGIVGEFPAVVPITVNVKDTTLDKEETFNATIAYNESLISKLGAVIAYASLSKMSDSLAESTVELEFAIKTNAVANGKLTRKNMYYNPSDVGQVAILELMQALNILCSNTAEEVDIDSIDVDISFTPERRTASIVSITPAKKSVKPGETVNLKIELQPYRKPKETVILPYTVPYTARSGNLTLEIHSGALVPVGQTSSGVITADSNKSFGDKIKDFLKVNRNNQLVVEVVSSGEIKTAKQLRKEIAQLKRIQAQLKKEGKTLRKADNTVDTDYIVDNVMRTALVVEKI